MEGCGHMSKGWIPEGWVGIKDAAAQMGVADKTIRRKIEAGELTAQLVPSPYGRDMWVVEESQIQTAQKIVDIVEVKQEYELKDIALTLSNFITERDADRDAHMTEQIKNLQQPILDEIKALREENEQLRTLIDQRLDERDRIILEAIREKQVVKKKPWWQFGK